MKRIISLVICIIMIFGIMPLDVMGARPLKRTLIVNNGTGGGQYYAGDEVTVEANTPPSGMAFVEWEGLAGVEFISGNEKTPVATFIMPSSSFEITAVFKNVYHLNVEGGTGTGDYYEGQEVTISANEPEENTRFNVWKGAEKFSFVSGDVFSSEAVILMPSQDANITAQYEDILDENMPVEVKVDDIRLRSGRYLESGKTSVTRTKPASDSYAYYRRGVLVLHNYVASDVSGPFVKVEEGDLLIKLEGKNVVNKSLEGNGISIGEGDLTVTGTKNDTLDMFLKDGTGIYISNNGNITIEGGKIKIIFEENSLRNESTGIRTNIGKISLTGADLDIVCEGWGIQAWYNVKITAGNINIDVDKGRGIEINKSGTLEVTGGDIKISSQKSGIDCANSIVINGGNVESVSEEGYGISALNLVSIKGGKVVGISKSEDRCGVSRARTSSDMEITVSKSSSGTPVAEYNGNSNDYPYFKAVKKTGILGDVDQNGKVNVLDANLVRRYAAKLVDLTEEQLAAADVDGNGKVNVLDANLIRRYAAKLIDKFPAEE
ncbi:MAG: carbohydrate-binding domain-containing protein [Oscillospiraceae bacterium]|nr:carbohydrate-binding domain-containing protein [Oscillospiraceae bacterium]